MGKGNTFIIGDVHGCVDMLKQLMDKLPWDPRTDRLIFLGDYIDRGEDPKGVVDLVLSLMECSPRVDCLLGNHEALFLNFLEGRDRALYFMNGGWNTLVSYQKDRREWSDDLVPPQHIAFYRNLKPYIELEEYYVVHAGFRPGVDIVSQSVEDMIWIREDFIYSDYDFGKRVIFGHTPFQEPLVLENKIGLDTGAVYNNMLSCLELPAFEFHCVEA